MPIGQRVAEIIEGDDVRFRPVRERESYAEHVGCALWFYDGTWFPLLQLVWPDRQGRFPDEAGFDESFRKGQPLLP